MTGETIELGNAEFLRTLRGCDLPTGQHMWATGFACPPEDATGKHWGGAQVVAGQALEHADKPGENNYFSVAILTGGNRRGANFARLMALVADDPDQAKLMAPPSWVLRTSAGST